MSLFDYITKPAKEIGSILSAGYTKPSQKGSNTSALGAMYDKYKNDLDRAKSVAGGLWDSVKIQPTQAAVLGASNSNIYYPTLPGSTNKSSSKSSGGGGSAGSEPAKYDSRGRITEEYKKWRDAKNASSSSSKSSSSAAKDAEKLQIEAEKRSEQAQIEAEQRAVERAAKEKAEADAIKIANIGKGWEDTAGELDATGRSLDTSSNYINNLGKVRDQYLTALDVYKGKTDKAISGNKTLIEQNQKRDLDSLAGDTRKSMQNTNVMLGVKGASGGSASKAAARAIAQAAGKERSSVLTAYGDQTSEQNQSAENAAEEYKTKRSQSYEWETTARQEALDAYNEERDALERLKGKQSGWREEDIKALSDRNLQTFLSGLNAIQSQARGFRDNLAAKMTEYGGNADALNVAAVNVTPPSELDTPKFDENIDMTDPENAEDWYDPKKSGKRVIAGKDALGRPIDENGNIIAVDENGEPIA